MHNELPVPAGLHREPEVCCHLLVLEPNFRARGEWAGFDRLAFVTSNGFHCCDRMCCFFLPCVTVLLIMCVTLIRGSAGWL